MAAVAILGAIKEVVYQYLVASDGDPDWNQVTTELLGIVVRGVLTRTG